jgi:uncharacterized protein YjbI with pentapeptide repeats
MSIFLDKSRDEFVKNIAIAKRQVDLLEPEEHKQQILTETKTGKFLRNSMSRRHEWGKHIASFLNPSSRPSAEVIALSEKIRNKSPELTKIYGSLNLERAHLEEAHLEKADLQLANLRDANLQGAHLEEAFLRGANLQGAHLEETHLEKADLQLANLQGAHLEEAHLEKADLQLANLQGAHLEEAHLEKAFLRGANLQGAHLEKAFLRGAHFREAHLEEADLRGAHLEGANLRWARLEGANLSGTCLDLTRYLPNITPVEIQQFSKTQQINTLTDPKNQYLLHCICNTLIEFLTGSGNLQVFNSALKKSYENPLNKPPPEIFNISKGLNASRLTRGIGSFLEGRVNDTLFNNVLAIYTSLRNRITDMSEQDIDRLVLEAVYERIPRPIIDGGNRSKRKNKRGKRSKKNKYI